MKYVVERARCQQAEQRGTQTDADDDFAHRRRLPATLGEYPADAAGNHDEGELEQRVEQQEFVLVRAGEGGSGGWHVQLRSSRH